jgi:hypothetical protein
MAVILVIGNPSDPATAIGFFWLDKFTRYASSKGHKVIFQKTPTLQMLYQALATYDPDLIVANGHGGFKSLRVGNNILIGTPGYDKAAHRKIEQGDTAYFTDRIVLLLTCNAGRELVRALVNNGATAAMGYKEPFVFLSDENLELEQDLSAKPFFEALLQPAIQLADGANFQQAINATREMYKVYLKKFKGMKDQELYKFLEFDYENLVAIGNPNARLKQNF